MPLIEASRSGHSQKKPEKPDSNPTSRLDPIVASVSASDMGQARA
jgi:hypothetical protein